MAKKKPGGMINIMNAPHIRPGFLICSAADLYKSNWEVLEVWSRVKDHKLIVTMRLADGTGKKVVSELDPDDTFARKIPEGTVEAFDRAEKEWRDAHA